MQFKFDEENLGLTQEQINHVGGKIESLEMNLREFFTNLEPEAPLTFTKLLEVVCSVDLTKEELQFTVASMVFNGMIETDSQNDAQTEELLDLINKLSQQEYNEDAL